LGPTLRAKSRGGRLSVYAGLEGCCVPGWRTVWLLPGHEGCWLSRPWVAAAWEVVKLGLVQVVGARALWAKNPERQ